MKVTLPYKSSYAANYQNLRFVESATGTILNHWFESVSNSSTAIVWVQVPSLTNGTYIDVYNGYPSSTGNGKAVFPLFDDFTTTASIDTTNWTVSGASISNNALLLGNGVFSYISHKSTQNQLGIGQDIVVESRIQSQSGSAVIEMAIRSSVATNNGIKGRMDCRSTFKGGKGGILSGPYMDWVILNNPDEIGMTINTIHNFKFVGAGNNFSCFLNNVQYGNTYSNSLAAYNTDGGVGIMNHNGTPVYVYQLWAYKYTSQTLGSIIS
jgi:hypothetical protein